MISTSRREGSEMLQRKMTQLQSFQVILISTAKSLLPPDRDDNRRFVLHLLRRRSSPTHTLLSVPSSDLVPDPDTLPHLLILRLIAVRASHYLVIIIGLLLGHSMRLSNPSTSPVSTASSPLSTLPNSPHAGPLSTAPPAPPKQT